MVEKIKYKDCPIGTRAYAVMGGYWVKTSKGWKWCTGDTFPTPGGDVVRIEFPGQQVESSCCD